MTYDRINNEDRKWGAKKCGEKSEVRKIVRPTRLSPNIRFPLVYGIPFAAPPYKSCLTLCKRATYEYNQVVISSRV
jgi:hypothetical protein